MTFIKKKWWLILIILVILGGAVGSFIHFREQSYDTYSLGMKAYDKEKIDKAILKFEETIKYPWFLGDHISKAEKKLILSSHHPLMRTVLGRCFLIFSISW